MPYFHIWKHHGQVCLRFLSGRLLLRERRHDGGHGVSSGDVLHTRPSCARQLSCRKLLSADSANNKYIVQHPVLRPSCWFYDVFSMPAWILLLIYGFIRADCLRWRLFSTE